MAKYRVKSPDGKTYLITAPDGATQEEVIAYAQQQFGTPAPEMTPAQKEAETQRLLPGVSTDPTEGRSFGQNVAAGFGKAFVDTGEGLKQLVGMGMTPEQVNERRQLDAPLMSTGGGITGNIAGQVTQVALPASGAAKVLSGAGKAAPWLNAAVTGAAFAAAQPVGEGQNMLGMEESRTSNAALGGTFGLAGQGVASVAGRAATRAKELIGPEIAKSIEAAKKLGIPLNAAQTSASNFVKAMQAGTKYLPLSGAVGSARRQQEAFNRAVARTFGADSKVLSDEVMTEARKKLSGQFEDIYSRNDVAITPDTVRRLADIERQAFQDMVPDEAGVIRNQVEKIIQQAQSGAMTGRMYQSLRTSLQSAEKNPAISRFVRQIRSELDDAAALSVGPKDAAQLAKVRSGWANLRTTEDALKQVSGASGNVRPSALYPLIRKGSTPEMRVLAKIGQNVLKDGIGDSGTAPRMLAQQALTGGIAAPMAVASDATGLAAMGLLAGRALNSKAAANLLGQGRPTAALAKVAKGAPRVAPVIPMQSGVMDIGTVSGYDRNDPRYRGD